MILFSIGLNTARDVIRGITKLVNVILQGKCFGAYLLYHTIMILNANILKNYSCCLMRLQLFDAMVFY